jgi:hypothetical protein
MPLISETTHSITTHAHSLPTRWREAAEPTSRATRPAEQRIRQDSRAGERRATHTDTPARPFREEYFYWMPSRDRTRGRSAGSEADARPRQLRE